MGAAGLASGGWGAPRGSSEDRLLAGGHVCPFWPTGRLLTHKLAVKGVRASMLLSLCMPRSAPEMALRSVACPMAGLPGRRISPLVQHAPCCSRTRSDFKLMRICACRGMPCHTKHTREQCNKIWKHVRSQTYTLDFCHIWF